jgi:DNA modification methylase
VGDTILDPFAGTLSSTLAAIKTGRHSIANEIDTVYFRPGVERVQNGVNKINGLFHTPIHIEVS